MIASTIFLLSSANLSGKRGRMLLNASAEFDLARALRSPNGAPLEQAFSFVSGLYFRGKAEYARRFGRALAGGPSAFVMTAGGGLCSLDETITKTRLEAWQRVAVSEQNPHFTAPLQRHACEVLDAHGPSARFVLLGSVATRKYVAKSIALAADPSRLASGPRRANFRFVSSPVLAATAGPAAATLPIVGGY